MKRKKLVGVDRLINAYAFQLKSMLNEVEDQDTYDQLVQEFDRVLSFQVRGAYSGVRVLPWSAASSPETESVQRVRIQEDDEEHPLHLPRNLRISA